MNFCVKFTFPKNWTPKWKFKKDAFSYVDTPVGSPLLFLYLIHQGLFNEVK